RKTRLEETWIAARALYAEYLSLFPDAADAYDLRFFYGELLYARDLKAESAEQYEALVKEDLSAKTPGRWLQKAAWSAVLARNEAMLHGGAEQKDTGERRAQRPLTADEQRLAEACNLYLKALPQGPHAVEVAFKAGRLEYISGDYDASRKHLSFIALEHPEHELAEYAANLVLDIENLRGDWEAVRRWALRFLEDRRLTAHGTLLQDLRRVEEQSAYALADAVAPDPTKAEALLAFVQGHPRGQLADKALFGAAAALSRAGRIDEALVSRARVWKEQPRSPLVPRALLASASDLARSAKQNPALQIAAWREAARLFAKAGETGNAQWSWTEVERVYRALGPKGREKLPLDGLAAAADAHFELGAGAFESFRKQEIRPPLMATLNRKIALLQAV